MLNFKNIIANPQGSFNGLKINFKDIDYIKIVDNLKEDVYFEIGIKNNKKIYHLPINSNPIIDGIKVDSYIGTWHSISYQITDDILYLLLEHEKYRDKTVCIIVDFDGNLILDGVWNGFDDLNNFLKI